MSPGGNYNEYARFLKAQGNYVITVHGIDWFDYNGFMIPAYLPHCCPKITEQIAREANRISGRLFSRWDTGLGSVKCGEWWYVLKRGPWSVESIKNKKKRWMVRQGRKNFLVRPLSLDEVISKCPQVAQLAAARYKGSAKIETYEILRRRAAAAQKVPGVLEYIGCFHENVLVSFSENYIQDEAVWLANIRHDPGYLNRYSGYALMDGILDEYLNKRRMMYVLDGVRSIHHRTQFQEHLMRVFGFTKEYAALNIVYSKFFAAAVTAAYPFRNIIWVLSRKYVNTLLDNMAAVLMQEWIRRSCAGL